MTPADFIATLLAEIDVGNISRVDYLNQIRAVSPGIAPLVGDWDRRSLLLLLKLLQAQSSS